MLRVPHTRSQGPVEDTRRPLVQERESIQALPSKEENTMAERGQEVARQAEADPGLQAGPEGAARTQGRPPFKVELVGKYDPTVDAKTWVERFEYFGRVTQTDMASLAKFFGMYLAIGTAFDWFTTLSDDIKNDFNTLKTKFIQRFGKKIDKVQTLADLFHMRQRSKQTVRDFIYEVHTKAHTADISQENILSAVSGGLLPHIRADLKRNPPQTLEGLIETAELSENAYAINPPQINFSEQSLAEVVKNAIGNVNMAELKEQVDILAANQAEICSINKDFK